MGAETSRWESSGFCQAAAALCALQACCSSQAACPPSRTAAHLHHRQEGVEDRIADRHCGDREAARPTGGSGSRCGDEVPAAAVRAGAMQQWPRCLLQPDNPDAPAGSQAARTGSLECRAGAIVLLYGGCRRPNGRRHGPRATKGTCGRDGAGP